jgi:hypothetical protein
MGETSHLQILLDRMEKERNGLIEQENTEAEP